MTHGTKPGPDTVLSEEEEAALMSYLVYMADRGFPLTRTMAMAFAWAIAKRSGKADRFNQDVGPGKHWWSNLSKRHPRLSLRRTDKLERSRAECSNPEVVDEYFELLKKVLDENHLEDEPRRIYNCDETFLPLDATRERSKMLPSTLHQPGHTSSSDSGSTITQSQVMRSPSEQSFSSVSPLSTPSLTPRCSSLDSSIISTPSGPIPASISDTDLSDVQPVTPSPIVSSTGVDSSQNGDRAITPSGTTRTLPKSSSMGIVNPLVTAGLIPADLADILATPPVDAATQR